MNWERINQLLEKAGANGNVVWEVGLQDEAAIVEVEKQLGVRLPSDFRDFVARSGGMGCRDSHIQGIRVASISRLAWENDRLPSHFLVVETDPDGDGHYCLDKRTFPASPIFWRDLFDEDTSLGKPCAHSFEQFLIDFFLRTWAK